LSNFVTKGLARCLRRSLVDGVARRRQPDFIIGDNKADPYMRRWWVIPRNRFFNIYLHHFLKDDDDRALHDHPWWSASLTLDGDMIEVYRKGKEDHVRCVVTGDLVFRSGKFAHRMIVPRPSWTIFITGPVYREWGFLCPAGWRHWKAFTAAGDKGGIGRGCE